MGSYNGQPIGPLVLLRYQPQLPSLRDWRIHRPQVAVSIGPCTRGRRAPRAEYRVRRIGVAVGPGILPHFSRAVFWWSVEVWTIGLRLPDTSPWSAGVGSFSAGLFGCFLLQRRGLIRSFSVSD